MKQSKQIDLETGALTIPMDIGSDAFKDFQLFIKSKSMSQTEGQRRLIKLMGLKFKMEDYLSHDSPEYISIGDFLKAFLSAAKIRQNKFAEYIGLQPSNFSKLLSGERKLNVEIALILGNIFDVSPSTWIGIQTKNELSEVSEEKMNSYSKYQLKALLEF